MATIPLLGNAEVACLEKWSRGPIEAAEAPSVTKWVAQGLQQSSRRTALVSGAIQLTHQELDEASNSLARLLRQRGIARGTRVGVCLPRGHDLVIALLAILKSGGAYVPLDPDYPSQRLNQQIDDADLALLVIELLLIALLLANLNTSSASHIAAAALLRSGPYALPF